MKSRLFLYGFTIFVIVGLAIWIVRNTYWDDAMVPMPLRGEAITNPFYASQRLAESLGARTEWRKTLGELPPHDAVMVLQHWNWDLIEQRRRQLEQWVERGGQLVFDSTFYIDDKGNFARWSGLSKRYVKKSLSDDKCYAPGARKVPEDTADAEDPDAEDEAAEPKAPDGNCRMLQTTIAAPGRNEPPSYTVCTLQTYYDLHSERSATWSLSNGKHVHAIRAPVGRGSVTVINAAPFDNRELTNADHGLLFAAATQLHRGGLIVFMSEEEYASLLELIWKYGAPSVVLALLLLAAALWRNGARFGPPVAIASIARRSLVEQIVGTGRFALRFGGGKALHAAAVRALHEAAGKRIPGYGRMDTQERVAKMAGLTHTDEQALAETLNYSGARRARDLKNAVELLERVRRRLLAENQAGDTSHAG